MNEFDDEILVFYFLCKTLGLKQKCISQEYLDDVNTVAMCKEKNGDTFKKCLDTLIDELTAPSRPTLNTLKYAIEVVSLYTGVHYIPSEKVDCRVKEVFQIREIVLYLCRYNDFVLRDTDGKYQDDREVIMTAIQNGGQLKYASGRLKDDKHIVMAAVQHYGDDLIYASDRLKDDKDIVMTAIRHEGDLVYASERLKDDTSVVALAILHRKYNLVHDLGYASERLKNDTTFLTTTAILREEYNDLKASIFHDIEQFYENYNSRYF